MATICSRVMFSCGANVVSLMPATIPFWLAQSTASWYHVSDATSVNGILPLTLGLPASRCSTATSMARVMGAPGLNSVSDMPTISSSRKASSTASKYHAPAFTSSNGVLGSLLRSSANSTVSDTALLPVL